MAFICHKCQSAKLNITCAIELSPDGWSDDIAIQILECEQCDFVGLATYEETRHGSSDSFHHTGYCVSGDLVKDIKRMMLTCTDRRNRHCGCAIHKVFGRQDENQTWDWIRSIHYTDCFDLKLANEK